MRTKEYRSREWHSEYSKQWRKKHATYQRAYYQRTKDKNKLPNMEFIQYIIDLLKEDKQKKES